MKIKNWKYTPTLSNSNSKEFKDLQAKFCGEVIKTIICFCIAKSKKEAELKSLHVLPWIICVDTYVVIVPLVATTKNSLKNMPKTGEAVCGSANTAYPLYNCYL